MATGFITKPELNNDRHARVPLEDRVEGHVVEDGAMTQIIGLPCRLDLEESGPPLRFAPGEQQANIVMEPAS
jgi:hypothetical protein